MTDQPPSEGFESWDDYWEARDRDVRDLGRDRAQRLLKRPQLPGNVR